MSASELDGELTVGSTVLNGRYRLLRELDRAPSSTVWEGTRLVGGVGEDDETGRFLIRLWRFEHEQPTDLERALWDSEVRKLHRLCSTPGAQRALVILEDAGVDAANRRLAMVASLPANEIDTAESVLPRKPFWRRPTGTRNDAAAFWLGLERLAQGVELLHRQEMIHGYITPRAVFLDERVGPRSFRLGGFEWVVRFGYRQAEGNDPEPALPPPRQFRPPDAEEGLRFSSDWYALGVTFGCLLTGSLPPLAASSKEVRAWLLERLAENGLEETERKLVRDLVAERPKDRLDTGSEVLHHIADLAHSFGHGLSSGRRHLSLVVRLEPGEPLHRDVRRFYQVSSTDPKELLPYIKQDLAREPQPPRLARHRNGQDWLLFGQRMTYLVTPYKRQHHQPPTLWAAAEGRAGFTDMAETTTSMAPITALPIEPLLWSTLRYGTPGAVYDDAEPWDTVFGQVDDEQADPAHRRLLDFMRFTNQLDLLLTDLTVYAYEIVRRELIDGSDHITVIHAGDDDRDQRTPEWLRRADLEQYVQAESDIRQEVLLLLDEHHELFPLAHRNHQEGWLDRTAWRLAKISGREVTLTRRRRDQPPAPARGYLRSADLVGQLRLIERRRRAIERVARHRYLLDTLVNPKEHTLDTEADIHQVKGWTLPKLDDAKHQALQQIWRVRPMYTLQGPPGTGKTFLTVNLLRLIFKDDPTAQVLVTSQAHAAVDHLMEWVERVMDRASWKAPTPLTVRLASGRRPASPKHSDAGRAQQQIEQALAHLDQALGRAQAWAQDPLSLAWRGWLEKMREEAQRWIARDEAKRRKPVANGYSADQGEDDEAGPEPQDKGASSGDFRDLVELVGRSASIVYATTTAAGLDVDNRDFDWSIIEESARAHAHDLTLPLALGHRWLLIGDHYQLDPFRYPEFEDSVRSVERIDGICQVLDELGDEAVPQLDRGLIENWQRLPYEERLERSGRWLAWVKMFRHLFEQTQEVEAEQRRHDLKVAPQAMRLDRQHRMHPAIAKLVSYAFYEEPAHPDGILSMTWKVPGQPMAGVTNPFVAPACLAGKAVVWVDVPWVGGAGADHPELYGEKGAPSRYNDYEQRVIRTLLNGLRVSPDHHEPLTLALLAPYHGQVYRLRRHWDDHPENRPAWAREVDASDESGSLRRHGLVHTVDSFQGNQAEIVIVSLVRNNTRETQHGRLGFLDRRERINVMLSRAERLLVVIGSYECFDQFLRQAGQTSEYGQGSLFFLRRALDYVADPASLAPELAQYVVRISADQLMTEVQP